MVERARAAVHKRRDAKKEFLTCDTFARSEFYFEIDILLTDVRTGERLVLDTKYKKDDRPDIRDIQQLVAYAVQMKTTKAILVYPSQKTHSDWVKVENIYVHSLVFDIEKDIEESGSDFLARLEVILTS